MLSGVVLKFPGFFLEVFIALAVDAVEALPDNVALIVAGNFNVALVPPLTETAVPVLVPVASEILIFLAVPHLSVVISAEPLKLVPFIFLLFCKVVAVEAFPLKAP